MTEVIFDKDFPEGLRHGVGDKIRSLSWLFPRWLQSLRIGYNSNDRDDDVAFVNLEKPYRFARLTICGAYLNYDDDEQRAMLIHELIHLHNLDFANFVRETMDLLCPKDEAPKFNESLRKMVTEKMEAMTQDIAFAIFQNLSQKQ